MKENMALQNFIIDKQAELSLQYRKVELVSHISVTLSENSVGENFTADNTSLNQMGYEVKRGEFPMVDSLSKVTGVENGTEVIFDVVAKGKRKPERKEFYFLWKVDADERN